jgi:hypothetical protein
MEINHISDISWPSFDEGNEFTRRKSLALVSKIHNNYQITKLKSKLDVLFKNGVCLFSLSKVTIYEME